MSAGTECEFCGPPPPSPAAQQPALPPEEEAKLRQFVGALIKRSNPFTYILIGINVALFVLMSLAGGLSAVNADHRVLEGFGAQVNYLIIHERQYWRLITCIFLHIGLLHLVFNNYALWIVGQEIERIYGSARFFLLYLMSGIGGSLASLFYQPDADPDALSAGASGSIFGLVGVLVTFAFRYRKEIPDLIRRDILRSAVPSILINLVITFTLPFIDKAAHIGGLASGMLLALIVPFKKTSERSTPIYWRILQVICIGIAFGSFLITFLRYDGPRPSLSNLSVVPKQWSPYLPGMIEAEKSFATSFNLFNKILISRDPNTEEASRKSLEAAVAGIELIDSILPQKGERESYRQKLRGLLEAQRNLVSSHIKNNPKDWSLAYAAETAIREEYTEWNKSFESWLSQQKGS